MAVTLLALAGPPPEGLAQRHDLLTVAPISLTAWARSGADPSALRIALRELRRTLVP